MNSMMTLGRDVMENAKIYARTKAIGTIRSVVSPLAGTISFMFDLVGYILQNPDTWKKPFAHYKKELLEERVREYPIKLDGKISVCRESLLIYAIRGRNRRVFDRRMTYRELMPQDLEREDFKKQLEELE